ncbi:ABC transporter ATP-binding protein [Cupriavidus sp. 2TAF22]|uniref:ABC transporter ATP-binding protein n=1 Tax=unclassified Cupriavidus TaxID=2640874 RepID=UPI003F93D512
MASVQIRGVEKVFGGTQVIRGVDIDIPDGQFTVLVGPSGCGKSTLLRMIAGLEEITTGEIAIGDRVVNQLPPKERDIAMVFQNYALYPHMTVYDNMAFSLKLAKAPREEIKQKVDKACAILGLGALLERYPRQLSGGQRQRVAMGRAIVRDPQVFLFDEPLSNLDAKLRVQMRAEIKELHQRLRTTSVYVTHDQIEAMTMADQIVVMRDGRVEQRGKPLELYDRPDNLFVAGFIGSPAMNFVPGTLRRQGGTATVEFADGSRVPAPARLDNSAGTDGQRVIYGVRPEHLDLGPPGQGLPSRVAVVEPTGANTEVYSRFCETEFISIFRERHNFAAGDILHLVPDHQHTHLFDADSGQALLRYDAPPPAGDQGNRHDQHGAEPLTTEETKQ